MRRSWIVAGVFGVLAASCSGPDGMSPASTAPIGTSPVITSPVSTSPIATSPVSTSPVSTSEVVDVPTVLADFRIGSVVIDGVEIAVAIADDARLRSQGLMNVTDLGSLDGMIFVWPDDTESTFWMKDTLIPLDIAWFDAEGRFVSHRTMAPCGPGQVCPNYAADAPYRYALEMSEGSMPDLDETSRLDLGAGF